MAKYIGSCFKVIHGNPDGFGMYYIHSSKARQNHLKRKLLNKKK